MRWVKLSMKTKIKLNWKPLIYLMPALSIIAVFKIYPIFEAFKMSFYTEYDYIKDIVYKMGMDNYTYVLKDADFYLALKNTSFFVLLAVPLSIALALLLAILLNQNIKGKNIFRSLYFLPFVTSVVAISTIWRWIFSKDYGLANFLLGLWGLEPKAWLTSPQYTLPLLALLYMWRTIGYKMVILLAGLQNIDQKYVLAAKMDGASPLKTFCYVKLPLLYPILSFVLITSLIDAFKIFDEVFVLYDQKTGPLKSGLTVVYYVFNKFYRHWQFTVSSAAAVILFILIAALTVFQMKKFKVYR